MVRQIPYVLVRLLHIEDIQNTLAWSSVNRVALVTLLRRLIQAYLQLDAKGLPVVQSGRRGRRAQVVRRLLVELAKGIVWVLLLLALAYMSSLESP